MEAAIEGARVRFRPILMTSFAFIAGLIPLVLSQGAGAVGNQTIGSSALGGMLMGTLFGVIIIPGLYYIFAKMGEGKSLIDNEHHEPFSEEYVQVSQQRDKLLDEMVRKEKESVKNKRKDQ